MCFLFYVGGFWLIFYFPSLGLTETISLGLFKSKCRPCANIIYAEIEKKQAEKKELEEQLTLEMVQHPQITVEQVKFFMEQFKNGDINDMKYPPSSD